VPELGFYDADALGELAVNLFYGWGYNFYRAENQLRADDQLVRSKAAWLLGVAMAAVDAAESGYRREYLPAPTRAKPFPDAAAVAGAQRLERLARAIGAVESSIEHQPVPENDRMTQRFRHEGLTLQKLIDCDQQLVGQCELLRSKVADRTGLALLDGMAELEAGLQVIQATLRKREAILFSPA
jgi:serine/threonine protein kinase HipA of HipAB toxin-antitoxin module